MDAIKPDSFDFQRQMQDLRASERARYLARSDLANELVSAALKTQGVNDFEPSVAWMRTIASMLKYGLEDPALRVLLTTLHQEHVLSMLPGSDAS